MWLVKEKLRNLLIFAQSIYWNASPLHRAGSKPSQLKSESRKQWEWWRPGTRIQTDSRTGFPIWPIHSQMKFHSQLNTNTIQQRVQIFPFYPFPPMRTNPPPLIKLWSYLNMKNTHGWNNRYILHLFRVLDKISPRFYDFIIPRSKSLNAIITLITVTGSHCL